MKLQFLIYLAMPTGHLWPICRPKPVLSFLGLVGNCWRLLRPRLGAIFLLGIIQDFVTFSVESLSTLAAKSRALLLLLPLVQCTQL